MLYTSAETLETSSKDALSFVDSFGFAPSGGLRDHFV